MNGGFEENAGQHVPPAVKGYQTRNPYEHPKSPVCALHLRRCCGTCVHRAGTLRDQVLARCDVLGIRVRAGNEARAAGCRHWTRPNSKGGK